MQRDSTVVLLIKLQLSLISIIIVTELNTELSFINNAHKQIIFVLFFTKLLLFRTHLLASTLLQNDCQILLKVDTRRCRFQFGFFLAHEPLLLASLFAKVGCERKKDWNGFTLNDRVCVSS